MKEGFKIIVLIKQVPDIEKVRFDVETGRIDRSSAPAETNPFDLNALEAALQIKERYGGVV
ncbi:MAG: electron transfer flavoprotein, beta subunit, partial [Thaumarchaeota archaeon]|nr:electron transfer flavoprotein, beta subunit [Nitrososphaerota archaeon]